MQRYVRMFGTPITLLALLAILILGARWGYRNVVAPPPPPPLVPCVDQNVGKALTTKQVTVQVYNGGSKSGLAKIVATQLRGAGFTIAKTGNTEVEVGATQIIGADVNNPEVKLVAGFFKGAKVTADGRADHTVEVRVGNAATGFNPKAPHQIAVTSPTVCLPSPSAIATPAS
ncbi:LytR C-terminal domain-containing protein [Luteococcus peritonei]|uniref:LytR C-terminal domain-containing protein n=1 Tax=Luteococcus peritonei TaxID=88874 RepID=A0ABW4RUC8_9ACTN